MCEYVFGGIHAHVWMFLAVYYLVIGLVFPDLFNANLDFSSNIYDHILPPFEDLLIVDSDFDCPNNYQEEPIYYFPGMPSKCGSTRGGCSRKRCCTTPGVAGSEFFFWNKNKFCSKRFKFDDLTFLSSSKCKKKCGNICLTDSNHNCPLSSVEFISKSQFKNGISNTTSTTYLEFNSSTYLVKANDYDNDDQQPINYLTVSFNGEPCFDSEKQPKWIGEDFNFQNQLYGCTENSSLNKYDTYAYAKKLDELNGKEFFLMNLDDLQIDDMERYVGDIFNYYENQQIYLYSLGRLELADSNVCWQSDFKDFTLNSDNNYSDSLILMIPFLGIGLHSLVGSIVIMFYCIHKRPMALKPYFIINLIGLIFCVAITIAFNILYIPDPENVKKFDFFLKKDCFGNKKLLEDVESFWSEFLASLQAKHSAFLALTIISVFFFVGLLIYGIIVLKLKKKDKKKIKPSKSEPEKSHEVSNIGNTSEEHELNAAHKDVVSAAITTPDGFENNKEGEELLKQNQNLENLSKLNN